MHLVKCMLAASPSVIRRHTSHPCTAPPMICPTTRRRGAAWRTPQQPTASPRQRLTLVAAQQRKEAVGLGHLLLLLLLLVLLALGGGWLLLLLLLLLGLLAALLHRQRCGRCREEGRRGRVSRWQRGGASGEQQGGLAGMQAKPRIGPSQMRSRRMLNGRSHCKAGLVHCPACSAALRPAALTAEPPLSATRLHRPHCCPQLPSLPLTRKSRGHILALLLLLVLLPLGGRGSLLLLSLSLAICATLIAQQRKMAVSVGRLFLLLLLLLLLAGRHAVDGPLRRRKRGRMQVRSLVQVPVQHADETPQPRQAGLGWQGLSVGR